MLTTAQAYLSAKQYVHNPDYLSPELADRVRKDCARSAQHSDTISHMSSLLLKTAALCNRLHESARMPILRRGRVLSQLDANAVTNLVSNDSRNHAKFRVIDGMRY